MRDRAIAAIVTATAAFAGAGAPPAVAAPNSYDGRWSVEVLTDRGNCEKVYRYAVIVENGRIRYGGSEPFQASGTVAANGAVQGSITQGQNRATMSGRLAGAGGEGQWTFSSGQSCSGHWIADKRG